MSPLHVRPAVVDDAEAIAAVHVASWQQGYRGIVADEHLARLDPAERAPRWRGWIPDTPVFVAEQDGRLAGFVSLAIPARTLDEPATGEITAFYVDPGHWRRGIGQALLDVAAAELREQGCDQLALWVLERNDRGRAFYAASGLEPDGTRAVDDNTGLPELLLRARLRA